jgi:hypothetical protein
LSVDTGDCGYVVQITYTSTPGLTEVINRFTFDVDTARKLHVAIGQAINEADEVIADMAEEALATIAGKPTHDPVQDSNLALVGAGVTDIPF